LTRSYPSYMRKNVVDASSHDKSGSELTNEYLWAIDTKGHVIGKRSRIECHKQRIIHRAVHVIVLDVRHRIFVKRRSHSKDMFPGQWETSVGGHVKYGDGVKKTAARELEEELGIVEPLRYLGRFAYRGKEEKENITLFYVVTEKRPRLNMSEAIRGEYLTIHELERCLLRKTFVDGTEQEVRTLKRLLSKLGNHLGTEYRFEKRRSRQAISCRNGIIDPTGFLTSQ